MSVIEINDSNFDSTISSEKGKVLVDCYATWCGPCKMLSPVIDELASSYKDCKFYKVDVDSASDVSQKYGIMSIPTLLLFENGKLIKQDVGFKSKDELVEFIEN